MAAPILATKLHIPSPRPKIVHRARLSQRLDEALAEGRAPRVTLLCAPAGFGKTTLIGEWAAGCARPVAWLSLDEGDNDPARFLAHLGAALQMIAVNGGVGMVSALQAPQPPPIEWLLTTLLNEIAIIRDPIVLVLDDYHLIDARPVDGAVAFLLEHLPPQMHLVLATREDPRLPLARLRARGQLAELRADDLRFTPAEAAEFLNPVMGLSLAAEDIAALESRTEGWIAGLQLAAISMRGRQDTARFIKSFTGSHRFVLDYLLEEVLQRQPERIQTFLLRTSILDRLCGPLCDALLCDGPASGQATLEYLERANLFIVPLDDERRWYRYHHLFAELLRQRLQQALLAGHPPGPGSTEPDEAELHRRASQWDEDNGLEIEAFQHAAAANDIERAARLIVGKGIPLHVRGGLVPVLNWLEALPRAALDARPVLWVMQAGALTTAGQTTRVEGILQAAEAALDVETRDLVGRIANNRATLAITQYQPDTVILQAHRALEYLRPDNLPVRIITTWALGVAQQMKGDRAAARRAFGEALSTSQTIGHTFVAKLAAIGLGEVQEADNQLYPAEETYRHALQLFGDQPLPIASDAHLGLGRILYEWNDLDAAEHHGQESLRLARQYADIIDRYVVCEVFLARLKLARGDAAGAAAMLAGADQAVRQRNFVQRMPGVAAAQVRALLRQGDLAAAARLTQAHELPLSRARVHLAQGDASAALAVLEPLRRQVEEKGWQDERLKAMALQAVALQARGEMDRAVQVLGDALALAAPGGFIRLFVDEGRPMARLLLEAAARGLMPDYTGRLLAAFEAEAQPGDGKSALPPRRPPGEPLSARELEVLRLIAEGLSNREIGERLFLALSTVKGHGRIIFDKLQVRRRTEAVARARELGLL